jgi:hypothetical protein
MDTHMFLHKLWRGWSLALLRRIVSVYELTDEQSVAVEKMFFKVNDWRVVFEPGVSDGA